MEAEPIFDYLHHYKKQIKMIKSQLRYHNRQIVSLTKEQEELERKISALDPGSSKTD